MKPERIEEVCTEEWGKISADVCHNLVSSYKRRLEAVLASKDRLLNIRDIFHVCNE